MLFFSFLDRNTQEFAIEHCHAQEFRSVILQDALPKVFSTDGTHAVQAFPIPDHAELLCAHHIRDTSPTKDCRNFHYHSNSISTQNHNNVITQFVRYDQTEVWRRLAPDIQSIPINWTYHRISPPLLIDHNLVNLCPEDQEGIEFVMQLT